jgi:ABC-type nitrate/sulfonate/bicarbonate transport system ATPase subunit
MLSLDDVFFWYDVRESPIVCDCSLTVGDKEFVAIVGGSGCGKSTLLKVASGLMYSYLRRHKSSHYKITGEIRWNNTPISEPHSAFGYVPQNFAASLMPWLTAERNVLEAVRKSETVDRDEERAANLLKHSGIYDKRNLKVRQLSGGQQQRVAICRALVTQPTLVFMDEPFANLDRALVPEITELIQGLREHFGVSLLVVTHDRDLAMRFADKVIEIRSGKGRPEYGIVKNVARAAGATST